MELRLKESLMQKEYLEDCKECKANNYCSNNSDGFTECDKIIKEYDNREGDSDD